MQTSRFKTTRLIFLALILIALPVGISCASNITQADVDLWKMWLNLAKNGYTEPMPKPGQTDKQWWKFWKE